MGVIMCLSKPNNRRILLTCIGCFFRIVCPIQYPPRRIQNASLFCILLILFIFIF
uniref:Uncharacterized protein n=1 Tax=Myoviridae sp. ctYA416 TaxID=2825125 RepID=A0A8S5UTG1_9CAUD|nr:MAG TPA: hypothetical protein [Myoviridae sp. ctYA416]